MVWWRLNRLAHAGRAGGRGTHVRQLVKYFSRMGRENQSIIPAGFSRVLKSDSTFAGVLFLNPCAFTKNMVFMLGCGRTVWSSHVCLSYLVLVGDKKNYEEKNVDIYTK